MAIIKYAESQFSIDEIHSPDLALSNPSVEKLLLNPKLAEEDESIRKRFVKYAEHLKRVAPKAKDFLYFSAIFMHSAERAIIDDNGEIKKDSCGNPIACEWIINKKGSWKWKCSDPNIRPYKNNNGDIFPEVELKKAYRKWVGRPLCKDHQSSSVDGVRGIIIDTYYDDKRKRVIGLCALDKINYPDLARKVATGYANNVSMGTAVGQSICSECGNIARVEADYCNCVKNKTTYGEINVDLSPIELSLVVTGADPGAQLRSVIASLNKYSEEKEDRINELRAAGCVTPGELDSLAKDVQDLRATVANLSQGLVKEAAGADEEARNWSNILKDNPELPPQVRELLMNKIVELASTEGAPEEAASEAPPAPPAAQAADVEVIHPPYGLAGNKAMTSGRGGHGYIQDLKSGPDQYNDPTGFDVRFASEITNIYNKVDALENALRDLASGVQIKKEEHTMSEKELRERAEARRAEFKKSAYHQGGGGANDPQTYPVDPLNDQVKEKEDKQMVGMYLDENPENLGGGSKELSLKKQLSRAELEERRLKRHAFLSSGEGMITTTDGKKLVPMQGTDGKTVYKEVASGAADDPEQDAEYQMEEVFGKKAYHQGGGGVNEPQTYPVDPTNDNVKKKEDKQMVGMYLDENPENLGGGAAELAEKKKHLRADQKLRAKFVMAFNDDAKTSVNKEKSRWEVYAGPDKVLEATGGEVWEDQLDDQWDIFTSKRYGREVLKAIRKDGLAKVAYVLKGEGLTKTAQPPAPPAPPAPPPAAGAPEMPPMDLGGEPGPEDVEEKEPAKDPVDQAVDTLTENLEEAEKALGDLKDALEETTGKGEADLPSPTEADDADDADDVDDPEMLATAEVTDKIQSTYAALDESADELAMLAESLESRKKAGKGKEDIVVAELLRLSKDAVDENVELRKEASLIIDAAKKEEEEEEENGEEEEKEDEKEDKKEKKEDKKEKKEDKKEKKEDKKKKKGKGKLPPALEEAIEKKKKGKKDEKEEKEDKKEKKSKAELIVEKLLEARAERRREMVRQAQEEEEGVEGAESLAADEEAIKAIVEKVLEERGLTEEFMEEEMEEEEHGGPEMAGVEVMEDEEPEAMLAGELEGMADDEQLADDVNMLDDELIQMLDEAEADDLEVTAEDRRAWREKIAAEVGAKYQLKLDPQTTVDTDMPLGKSFGLGQLDTKTPEATVEGLVEMHEEIMKAVQNLPKVREAMEHLGGLLKKGALNLEDLSDEDKLKALAVDPAAAKYWKDYFGEGDSESKTFGAELTKEYAQKKTASDLEEQKVRMKRAFAVALEMQEKGLLPDGKAALDKQVDDLMKIDAESFESFKRALGRATKPSPVKTAAPALQVGVTSDDLGEGVVPEDLSTQVLKLWD